MTLKYFITHSWRDNAFAQELANDLRRFGLDGFFDMYSIKHGDDPDHIIQGLEACDVYVPILSHAALESPWCKYEINLAITLRNRRDRVARPEIAPVLVEHC